MYETKSSPQQNNNNDMIAIIHCCSTLYKPCIALQGMRKMLWLTVHKMQFISFHTFACISYLHILPVAPLMSSTLFFKETGLLLSCTVSSSYKFNPTDRSERPKEMGPTLQ